MATSTNPRTVDTYRVANPDEVASPGYAWKAVARAAEADLVVTPWPSDHRAVAATVRF